LDNADLPDQLKEAFEMRETACHATFGGILDRLLHKTSQNVAAYQLACCNSLYHVLEKTAQRTSR
jgi:hypothetical protein